MKFTQVLFKQHKGRLIRFIWQTQRERPIWVTKAEDTLSSMGVQVEDPLDLIHPKKVHPRIEVEYLIKKVQFDESHPDWHNRSAYLYQDNYILQEGLAQAQLLTKTALIANKLPSQIEDLITDVPEHVHKAAERIISTSAIFDAYQELLPKVKDPERPAWVFPREYGITKSRKMRNLSRRLLQLCETVSTLDIVANRNVVQNGYMSTCLDKDSDLLNLPASVDLMITSSQLLKPIAEVSLSYEVTLPNIFPLDHMIGLSTTNIYKNDVIYPISTASSWLNLHTIFIHHDPEQCKNLTELPVSHNQIMGRALTKSFIAAACCAQKKFGVDLGTLPEPVTIQCIHTDGQNYQFGVLQLNTLDLNGTDGIKNFWWLTPELNLYEKAQYEKGRPVFSGYNEDVLKTILAFYNNTRYSDRTLIKKEA